MTELTPVARMEAARQELPFAVQKITQFIVDNPGQVLMLGAAGMVATMAARNICKPRGLVETLAVMAMLDAAGLYAAQQIVRRGWLGLRVRDADGNLIPLKAGE